MGWGSDDPPPPIGVYVYNFWKVRDFDDVFTIYPNEGASLVIWYKFWPDCLVNCSLVCVGLANMVVITTQISLLCCHGYRPKTWLTCHIPPPPKHTHTLDLALHAGVKRRKEKNWVRFWSTRNPPGYHATWLGGAYSTTGHVYSSGSSY